ncbi:RidA family protein [Kumtagia ephedrae]|uniref:Enamine deaminase RidA n=1 Tax=Kumtagia ephedrae TaxID=2116701 RepID=A0A2P7S7E8_9HYPH|nr:RidA family protein [Mesorhizobium ephedrae]PSJ58351.1 enamine deaminase RidA [Mesorhizobium ephedrae]
MTVAKLTDHVPAGTPHRVLQPQGWAKPIGYANGIEARGRTVFVGGQIGWNAQCRFEAHDLPGQVRQALANIVAILQEAGAGPEHVTTLTWYVLDRKVYSASLKEIGAAYRATMGRNFPAMAVVEVSGLVEDEALVEIQATAVVPD